MNMISTHSRYESSLTPSSSLPPSSDELTSSVRRHTYAVISSRSFNALPPEQQELARDAGDTISRYTYFQNPFMNAQALLDTIEDAWNKAENNYGYSLERLPVSQSWVSVNFRVNGPILTVNKLKGCHSRARSHLLTSIQP